MSKFNKETLTFRDLIQAQLAGDTVQCFYGNSWIDYKLVVKIDVDSLDNEVDIELYRIKPTKIMTTETILTSIQVDSLLDGVLRSSGSRLGNYTFQKTLDELRSAVRSIEQAILQSPELQALKRDKERLDWLADPKNNIGNVQLPTVCVERNPHSLRDAIDDAMEYKK